jgi:hypothetical protein
MPELASDGPIPESTPEAAAPAYAGLPASFGEYAGDIVSETAQMAKGALDVAQYSDSGWGKFGRAVIASSQAAAGPGPADMPQLETPDLAPTPSSMLSKAEATARHPDIAKAVPDLFSDNSPEGVVDALADSKRAELEREGVFSRYEDAHSWYTNFPTRMALTMLDPVNAASLLIPGIGEETVLARLGTGALARTGARLVAGGTAGLAGMSLGVGARYALSQAEGGDYGLRQAFLDLASGAALGAVVHGAIGLGREAGYLRPDQLMTGHSEVSAEPPPEQTAEGPGESAPPTAQGPIPATADERASLQALLDRQATPDEINQHPIIQRAMDAARAKPPTTDLPGFGTDEFKTAREFNFNGEKVTGYDAAIDRLTDNARAYSGDTPVGRDKQAVLVFGPPAAGKSRLVEGIAKARGMAIPDPDDAKRVIPEYDGGTGAGAVHEESTLIAAQVTKQLVQNGENIAVPMIGRTMDKVQRLVDRLKANGYDVDLINLTVDPEEAYRRAVGRFVKTGRISSWDYLKGVGKAPRDNYYSLKQGGSIREGIDVDGNRGPQEEPHFLDGGETNLAQVFRSGRSVARQPGGGAGAQPDATARAEVQAVLNTDAATRYDATSAAVAQILDGRPVEVGPILDATNPGSQSFAPQLAQQQADLHRAGFEPSMTAAELQAATEDLYGRPADADETDTSVAGIPRDADGNDSVRFRPGSETPGAAVAQGAEATAARPAAAPAQQGEGALPAAAPNAEAATIPRPAWAGSAPPEVQGIINAPEVAEAIANPKIIRDKNVPDGAGYVAGGQTAVDPRIGDSWTIGDKTFDPAIPANIHEQTEHFEMERQIAAKQAELDRPLTDAETKAIYDNVHENIATVAEMAWVDAQGIDRKAYDEKWDGFLSATEHEDPTNAPAGLYLKPYDPAMAEKLRAAGATEIEAAPSAASEPKIATAAVDRAIHAPVAERGAEGLPQLVLPGAEQSARQAAAAREAQGPGIRSEAEQEAPGGLFAPPQAEGEQASLFGPYEIKTPDLDRDLAEAEHDIGLLQLTPEDRAEIDAAGQEVNLAGLTEQAYAQAAECLAGAV